MKGFSADGKESSGNGCKLHSDRLNESAAAKSAVEKASGGPRESVHVCISEASSPGVKTGSKKFSGRVLPDAS